MDPFTIHCSSCHSRIRVRNPSMIGQIANCPKCGSMIMIAAPESTAAAPQQILVDSPTGSVTDSVAVTKEALPVPQQGLFGDMHPLEQGFDQAFRSEGLRDAATPESGAFESLAPTHWMPEPTPPPRIDEPAPNVPPASNSRQIMLVGAIGLCSVAIACGIFFAFLQWYARPSAIAANRDTGNRGAGNQAAGNQAAASVPTLDPALATRANVADLSGAATLPEVATDADKLPALEAEAEESLEVADSAGSPVSFPQRSPQETEIPTEIASEDTAASLGTGGPVTSPAVPKGAPLGSVGSNTLGSRELASGAPLGSQLMPDIDSTFAGPGAEDTAPAVKETLPPGLQNFASIFDQSLVPVLSDASVPLGAAPEAGDDEPQSEDVAASTSPLTLAIPETLEQKQATTLSGLLIRDRPLPEVVSTLSLTSDIPFTADLDGLLAAGVDRNQPLNFKSATPVTVLDVLSALARDYSLSFEPYEKKLFIVRGSAGAVESRVPSRLPIADLVDGADQSAALGAALSELLPELGGGFQFVDGAAQGDLDKVNRLLWFQVARLLQTWRAARGIENADTAALVPESSHLPAWPVDAAQKAAQKKITQTLLPTPLAHGWHRLADEAGLTCWVDWPSLISAQTPPSQIGMSISRERPLQELLQHDAEKYQVVFAIEDEQTLWITSPEMHRFQPRLYVLPIAGKTIEEWRSELEPLTPFNPDGTVALKVVASPDGHFVFVRCCRPVLAQPQL